MENLKVKNQGEHNGKTEHMSESESKVAQLCLTLCDPMSMRFSRQEYWSGLPFPFPEDLLDTGIEPASPALVGSRFFTTAPPRKQYVPC